MPSFPGVNSGGEFYGARSGRRADLLVTLSLLQLFILLAYPSLSGVFFTRDSRGSWCN
jgi:hypothetical protein